MELKDLTKGAIIKGENGEQWEVESNFGDGDKIIIELLKKETL
jgi:hypothetical protein